MNNNLNHALHEQYPHFEQSNNRAEQILHLLESELKNLIADKRALKIKFQTKFQELQNWFNEQWKEATKLENKFILLWDYWQREVKILALEKQLSQQVLSSERKATTHRLSQLITLNANLEKGFKERNIDPQLMEQLRRKIGAWEEVAEC